MKKERFIVKDWVNMKMGRLPVSVTAAWKSKMWPWEVRLMSQHINEVNGIDVPVWRDLPSTTRRENQKSVMGFTFLECKWPV